uniref:Putative secreted protein n=1 Tax=Anopheles darlingi TaxID=43151 RepID=A0A2M4DIE4_ANODA
MIAISSTVSPVLCMWIVRYGSSEEVALQTSWLGTVLGRTSSVRCAISVIKPRSTTSTAVPSTAAAAAAVAMRCPKDLSVISSSSSSTSSSTTSVSGAIPGVVASADAIPYNR